VRPGDTAQIDDLVTRLSTESIEERYFSPIARESVIAELLQPDDVTHRLSLLLYRELPERTEVLGQGEYTRDGPRSPSAEVAFLVADAYQGRGAASILLTRLARSARDQGIQRFRAIILPENLKMLDVFRGSGFPCAVERRTDHVVVTLAIAEEPHPSYAALATPPARVGAQRPR
jgi:RimJ/RimL family protein N-acetyltransferase